MTLPAERTRAVTETERFLFELADATVKRIPKAVRQRAMRLLHHYPTKLDLADLARRAPDRWGKPED